MATSTRKLAAIMFTDIVGYTALMGEDEHQAMKLLEKNREVQKPLIEKHNGTWLKELGDGTLSSFTSAIDAVNCAIEIQRVLKWDPQHNLRIGIHVGDVVFEKGDVFGAGVNVASRLEPLAEPGGICVSGRVHDDIINKPDIDAVFLGEKELKNVDHPVKVYALTGEGLAEPGATDIPAKLKVRHLEEVLAREKAAAVLKGRRKPLTLTPYLFGGLVVIILALILYPRFIPEKTGKPVVKGINPKSVAVLPFTPFTKSEEDESFTAGIHDDILTQLAKIRDLMVISRTSVVRYKDTQKSMREIAAELNVANILEGSVRRAGDRIRIVAQLVKTDTDEHLWAETYDRDYADIFAIQSDVAQKIASALKATLTPEEKGYIEEKPTANMEAYDYFLKGNYYWNTKITKEGNLKAVDMYEKAIELDPDFALAYARVSVVHSALYNYLPWDHTQERREEARTTMEKASALDPDHPEVHFARGFYYDFCIRDYDRALDEYEIAFRGQPNSGEIAQFLGGLYRRMGRWDKAEVYLLKAYELDPKGINVAYMVAQYYQSQRDWERAERYYNLAISADPENAYYYGWKARNYLYGYGDMDKARGALEEGVKNVGTGPMARFRFWVELYSRDYQEALLVAKSYSILKDRSLYKGLAYYFHKEDSASRAEFDSARVIYEQLLREDPESASYHSSLGLAYAGLGMKAAAIREGKIAVELMPITKDAVYGPFRLWDLGDIYIMIGEYDLAIDKFEHLLSIPSRVTKWVLKLYPLFDPLRDHPRFQKLIAEG